MEEQHNKVVLSHVQAQSSWDALPSNVKQLVGNSKAQYHSIALQHCLHHQLAWKTSIASQIVADERQYYQELVRFNRARFMMFPYHLQEVLMRLLKLVPFRYYYTLIQDVMESEKSYDTLPNFTAADGVRLLGIGRNQFIDIMNECRQKTWIFNKKKSTIVKLLPTAPIAFEIQFWWVAHAGILSEEAYRSFPDVEKEVVDLLLEKPRLVGELPKAVVTTLYRRGNLYLDVPINNSDQIIVPPLEGFVMNRVMGDYFENLLYKIFVSLDERTTIIELATTLQVPVESVKQAISVYIRLGFAKKKNLAKLVGDSNRTWHESWASTIKVQSASEEGDEEGEEDELGMAAKGKKSSHMEAFAVQQGIASGTHKRVAFMFDSTITAYLMMGNLGAGLKSHAVTLFEVGKLPDEAVDDFLAELDKVMPVSEGEAQTYHDHAITLRETVKTLRYNSAAYVQGSDGGVDLFRSERLESLETNILRRILSNNYSLLISMAPISVESKQAVTSCVPPHHGPAVPEVNSPWFQLFLYDNARSGPPSMVVPKGRRLRHMPERFAGYNNFLVTAWQKDASEVAASHVLATVNDILLVSPVLIQAYSSGNVLELVNVGLPLSKEQLSMEPLVDVPDGTYTKENMHRHPIIHKLYSEFDLQNTLCYATMLKLEVPAEESWRWVLLELKFGMPLFSIELNEHMRNQVVERALFSEAQLEAHSKSSRKLSLRLLDYVAGQVEDPLDLQPDELPLPTRTLVFAGDSVVPQPLL